MAVEAKHVALAGELGLPLDHDVFSLWRLTDPLGSGAFSKVQLDPSSCSCRCWC